MEQYDLFSWAILDELRQFSNKMAEDDFNSKILRVYTKCLIHKPKLADKIYLKYKRRLSRTETDLSVSFKMLLMATKRPDLKTNITE